MKSKNKQAPLSNKDQLKLIYDQVMHDYMERVFKPELMLVRKNYEEALKTSNDKKGIKNELSNLDHFLKYKNVDALSRQIATHLTPIWPEYNQNEALKAYSDKYAMHETIFSKEFQSEDISDERLNELKNELENIHAFSNFVSLERECKHFQTYLLAEVIKEHDDDRIILINTKLNILDNLIHQFKDFKKSPVQNYIHFVDSFNKYFNNPELQIKATLKQSADTFTQKTIRALEVILSFSTFGLAALYFRHTSLKETGSPKFWQSHDKRLAKQIKEQLPPKNKNQP